MRKVGALLLFLMGCSKPHAIAEQAEASAPMVVASVAPAVDAAPVDAGPQRETNRASYAIFESNTLVQCVDLGLTELPRFDDAGKRRDRLAEAGKTLGSGARRIEQSCSEAFADRTVLASCNMGEDNDAGSSVFAINYYDFAKVGISDKEISDCFENKGRWSAIARTSPEWARAKLDYDSNRLRGLTRHMGGQ